MEEEGIFKSYSALTSHESLKIELTKHLLAAPG